MLFVKECRPRISLCSKIAVMTKLDELLREIRACEICLEHLPEGPRPVVAATRAARVLIIGQAPGRKVHASGIAWNDPSGDRLRDWMGVTKTDFYDAKQIALMPMGFCYPGTGKGGDLPPRPECAEAWHDALLKQMPKVQLTLLLSRYAHLHYLCKDIPKTVTETVRAWKEHRPRFVTLPHPSPRNNIWLRKKPWFETEVLPYLRRRVKQVLKAKA